MDCYDISLEIIEESSNLSRFAVGIIVGGCLGFYALRFILFCMILSALFTETFEDHLSVLFILLHLCLLDSNIILKYINAKGKINRNCFNNSKESNMKEMY